MNVSSSPVLQWGRNFIVAETRPTPARWWWWSRRFNGAATLSLRKRLHDPDWYRKQDSLQWGRNFIVAETGHLHELADRDVAASMGPQLYRCGNSPPQVVRAARHRASMGPQLYRCGNLQSATWHCTGRAHASMGPQLYRCGNTAGSGIHRAGPHRLQWGRNFIVAETRQSKKRNTRRQWRFNGAATLSLRKHTSCGQTPRRQAPCFNGAATLSLRKRLADSPRLRPTNWLQWGRNFIVAETRTENLMPWLCWDASMGPQLYRCGNTASACETSLARLALQWGRNFIVAETHEAARKMLTHVRLQWGRNFIVAETRRAFAFVAVGAVGFNGAATLSLRKRGPWAKQKEAGQCFNRTHAYSPNICRSRPLRQ